MITKTQLSLAALLLIACSMKADVPPLIDGESVSFFLDEWDRTSYFLIEKPRAKAHSKRSWFGRTRAIPGTIATIVGLISFGLGRDNREDFISLDSLGSVASGAVIACPFYFALNWLKNRSFGKMVIEEERAAMTELLDKWKDLKAHFPQKLHKPIEALAEYRKANDANYIAHLDTAIALVKEAVMRHNWQKKNQRPWYS